jgi:hypothetical protein
LEHSNTSLLIATDSGPRRVPAESIDSFWVRRNNLGKGLAWGAGIGTVAGLASGVLVNQTLCRGSDSGCDDDDAKGMLITGILGLGAGTFLGAIVGAVSPEWHRRMP